ncbi:MAG: hypothetical protein GC136_05850 [Alphaproteobacteria bacterium]|nr:hypothetical protein [Alphaproteobacteria bacterium]
MLEPKILKPGDTLTLVQIYHASGQRVEIKGSIVPSDDAGEYDFSGVQERYAFGKDVERTVGLLDIEVSGANRGSPRLHTFNMGGVDVTGTIENLPRNEGIRFTPVQQI